MPVNVAVTFTFAPPITFFAYHSSCRHPAMPPVPVVGPTAKAYVFPAVSVIDDTFCVLLLYQIHTAIRLPLVTGVAKEPVLIEFVFEVTRPSLSLTKDGGASGTAAVVTFNGVDWTETFPDRSNAATA